MKRELKEYSQWGRFIPRLKVTKPIPMKRELKEHIALAPKMSNICHKANPDEKGTESLMEEHIDGIEGVRVTKPIPMKRELKARSLGYDLTALRRHKANPDEKGTEREIAGFPDELQEFGSQSQSR